MTALVMYLAPLALLAAASRALAEPGLRPRMVPRLAQCAAVAAVGAGAAALLALVLTGPATATLAVGNGLGFSARLDAVSVTMLILVSFIGWVVLRFSASYLDGEPRQGAFTGWMAALLASVLLLVIAGNLLQLVLAWIATGVCLQRLLLFYPDRPGARRAGAKKAVVTRLGTAALILAAVLLYASQGTGDIATIATALRDQTATGSVPPLTLAAAGFLALAAVLKSAQVPTQGWLTEVMETPTPVSAMLHAGVVNAGGFLLIRFADVLLAAPLALAALAMLGGATAILGALTMLTQSAVKTSLAWSTVAQMGFLIMQCGLALFPLALLHIVAHSLYKAHAFLNAGTAVERIAAERRPGPVAVPDAAAVGRAFALAIAIYAAIGLVFGFADKSPQAIALGAILIFGVAYLLAQGLAGAAPRALWQRTAVAALAASCGYFLLQRLAGAATAGTLPPTPAAGALEWALILLALISFGLVAVAQALFPLWAQHPAAAALRVHLSNGLYANALFDRLIGAWSPGRHG